MPYRCQRVVELSIETSQIQAMPRLYAISDIHLSYKHNREAFERLSPHPEDSLILAGDVGESLDHLRQAFVKAVDCFKHVFWVPGNHELYTMRSGEHPNLTGEAKYNACVLVAREYGVMTPEDEWMTWEGDGGEKCIVALCFTLYDYSFRPSHVSRDQAVDWAAEEGIRATDEDILHFDPFSSRDEWCRDLVESTEKRLAKAVETGLPLVIVNHWPLREDLVFIPQVPRFSIWCGTKKTHEWHMKFNARVVVTGHLHVRRTDWVDGVRFEEVSLGYPRQWKMAEDRGFDVNMLLREIMPGAPMPEGGTAPTQWRRDGIGLG